MKKIHVGFLLSYDYELLKYSLPPVYKFADKIFLAKDINNKTWSGNNFTIDPSFFVWLNEFDIDNKIEIYEDDFSLPNLNAIENDTRERTMLSKKMGIGNWLIQIDSDEYFLDFEDFVKKLRKYDKYLENPEKNKIQIFGWWLIIYKYTETGILYVNKPLKAAFATNYPNYTCARRTDERVIYFNNLVLHESVARTEKELEFKLKNWGHNKDVNPNFLDKWKSVSEFNYKEMNNFYYIEPERWKKLGFFPTKDLNEIKKSIHKSKISVSYLYLAKKNLGQWFKHLFKK
ncbi:hypothetical protein [Flavobacterium sp.]|jgi:hypothetical protein|uniref:hypothetical protein n=1 Tax=Flavobacterium sp. TaxID=239 RepID=UPI0037BF04F5